MLSSYEMEYFIYIIILGVGLYNLYKAYNQIRTKDFDFFKKEIYTKESVEKWAVVDGWLKVAASLTLCAYGGFGLAEIKIMWFVIVLLAVILGLYFYLYAKTLVKKKEE